MKTLQESIIGRKGIYRRKNQIPKSFDDLKYGDFIEISGDFGGTYLYVPQHVVNEVFNFDNSDAFIRYSDYWRAESYCLSFPYDRINKTHKIERIIGSVSKDEYENLKNIYDVFRLFHKYNMRSE